jgi:hypothetical protein
MPYHFGFPKYAKFSVKVVGNFKKRNQTWLCYYMQTSIYALRFGAEPRGFVLRTVLKGSSIWG